MVGQNLSLKLELQGDNSVSEVHANRDIQWTTPSKRLVELIVIKD